MFLFFLRKRKKNHSKSMFFVSLKRYLGSEKSVIYMTREQDMLFREIDIIDNIMLMRAFVTVTYKKNHF